MEDFSKFSYAMMAQEAGQKMAALRDQAIKAGIWKDPSAGAMAQLPGYTLGKNKDSYGMFNLPKRQHSEQVVDLYNQQKEFLNEGSLADRVAAAQSLNDSALYNTVWNKR